MNKIPAVKPTELPTMIAVGVASPKAQGQAITKTAIAILNAKTNPDPERRYHEIKVNRAITITAGTNQLDTLSAIL